MTRKTTAISLNPTITNPRKSGKNEYDRKVTKIDVVTTCYARCYRRHRYNPYYTSNECLECLFRVIMSVYLVICVCYMCVR